MLKIFKSASVNDKTQKQLLIILDDFHKFTLSVGHTLN